MKRVIEGEVVGLTRNTEGYGVTLRSVGIDVELEYQFLDPIQPDDTDEDKYLARKSKITVPYELASAFYVGQHLDLTVEEPEDK